MAYTTEISTIPYRPMMVPIREQELRYLKDRLYSAEKELSEIRYRDYDYRRSYYAPFREEYYGLDMAYVKPEKPMNKLSLLARKIFDPASKKLIKAGVLGDDLSIKDTQFVLSFIVNKYKKELALEADKKIAEEKESE